MILPADKAAFADVRPEGGDQVHTARREDSRRVERMLATDPARWSDDDVDLVVTRAMTTIGGAETFKWVLPHVLERSLARPYLGWMTESWLLAEKLDYAGFDQWPPHQRTAALHMLTHWLEAQAGLYPDDPTYDPGIEHAVLRRWLEART